MSEARPAPYPPDTRAKGWRFELDLEQVRQSTTWARAKPEARAWLLMLWAVAWEQSPCGSLPNDREAIAGLLGVPDAIWKRHADALLRGFWAADDGRLYHPTLTKRVEEMMQRRRSESDRKAAARAKKLADSRGIADQATADSGGSHGGVPYVSRGTDVGLHPESDTDHRPPNRVSKTSSSHPRGAGEGRFPEFWGAWPSSERKQDRKACLAKWKLHNFDAIADAILADVATKRATSKWQGGFIEAPLVYLNNRRWEDGVQPDDGRPGEAVAHWSDSVKGVVAKGVELGAGSWSEADWAAGRCSDYLSYRARVFKAAGHSPRVAA